MGLEMALKEIVAILYVTDCQYYEKNGELGLKFALTVTNKLHKALDCYVHTLLSFVSSHAVCNFLKLQKIKF